MTLLTSDSDWEGKGENFLQGLELNRGRPPKKGPLSGPT
jgi:hypothetical protein